MSRGMSGRFTTFHLPTARRGRRGLFEVLGACLLAVVVGCSTAPPPVAVAPPPAEVPGAGAPEVSVAFSGGGWRAHTAHAAWVVGLLANPAVGPQRTLDDAFRNVGTISSNSGGSWFNVMLGYSSDYRRFLQTPNLATTYTTDPNGYFGLQKSFLQGLPTTTECDLWSSLPQLYFFCTVGEAIGAPLDWHALIEDVVFEPYGMASRLSGTTLSGGPQGWADPKQVLLAATALTHKSVLTGSSLGNKYYYSAPYLVRGLEVAPVTFASVPGVRAFPSAPVVFDTVYDSNGWFSRSVTAPNNLGSARAGDVRVVTAAAASSAAVGFIASHAIVENNNAELSGVPLTDWEIAYEGENLPVYFNLPDPQKGGSQITRSPTGPTSDIYGNAAQRFVQLADGGPLDNSAVVQAVARHQRRYGTAVPFEIVAFDAVQESVTPRALGRDFAPVGIDIAALFGLGFTPLGHGKEGFCTGGDASSRGFCVTVVNRNVDPPASPQIFVTEGIYTGATWRYPKLAEGQAPADDTALIYTRYQVTTVASPLMGVYGGTRGTLHAFTTRSPEAQTAPWTTSSGGPLGDEDWKAYAAMFETVQEGLTTGGGWGYLRSAFGLP